MKRSYAIDVFRGLTIAGMILVNNPGTWSAMYSPLGHAEWHGWTVTDLIFPFFLIIVGVSICLSFGAGSKSDLSHASTQNLAPATGLFDEVCIAGEHAANRA